MIMNSEMNKYKTALKKAIDKINELDNQLKEVTKKDEIAIIGYNCRFPMGANSASEFWRLLEAEFDAVTEIGIERFDIHKYYDEEKGKKGKTYTKYASFLDTDINSFDYKHFEISSKESEVIDPQHRLLLEVTWEALENAELNIDKLKGSKTGVFIGLDSFDYAKNYIFTHDVETISPYSLMGMSKHSAAGRISYFYDFKGPAIVCDTACSSSLVALNIAIDHLRSGQCDLAIVGGANLLICPESFVGLSQFQGLSADGKCKTFDNSADGFGRGEGCGIVILKRLSDAKADGNTVEAIIKGGCTGQDGRSNGFYAPNGLAEKRVLEQALKNADLTVNDIDYIEAHGTGTEIGDFIECQAICEVYKNRKKPILIGSVKSNIGHLEAASGMAGLIKVLLSMKNEKLPASIHVKNRNKNIDWNKINVVTTMLDWKRKEGKCRRAGISAFGISGTLAHVIIEEPEESMVNNPRLPYGILTLSAKSPESLRDMLKDILLHLEKKETDFIDCCFTSNITRSFHTFRYSIIENKKENLIKKIQEDLNNKDFSFSFGKKLSNKKRKIAFLFTGQGSIYKEIAKELYECSITFKDSIQYCNDYFYKLLNISILDGIYFEKDIDLMNPMYSQPIIFSIEYSLTKLWDKLGIKADFVIGHSIGEYVAACYAGILSCEDAMNMIAWRSKLMDSVTIKGKMVGILTDEATLKKAIMKSGCKQVSVAAVNALKNVTLSGVEEEVNKVIDVLQKENRIFINELKISHPFHSIVMEMYEEKYRKKLQNIKFMNPKIQFISSMTGKIEKEDTLGDVMYWSSHLSKTVYYEAAIKEAEKQGVDIFIEIGGDATLSGLAMQIIGDSTTIFANSLRKGASYSQILTAVKKLYLAGIHIEWKEFYKEYGMQKCILPNYPFQKRKLNVRDGNNVPDMKQSNSEIKQKKSNEKKCIRKSENEEIKYVRQLFENQMKIVKGQNELLMNVLEDMK